MPSKFQKSNVTINNPSIPDGVWNVAVSKITDNADCGFGRAIVIGGKSIFNSGAVDGDPVMINVARRGNDPDVGAMFPSTAVGPLECFSNDTVKVGDGFFDVMPISVYGGDPALAPDWSLANFFPEITTVLPNGSSISFNLNTEQDPTTGMVFSPNGAFDHLDPLETEAYSIPVSLLPHINAANLFAGTFYDSTVFGFTYDSPDSNAWLAQADDWYTINPEGQLFVTETRRYIQPNLIVGRYYKISMLFRDSTTLGRRNGLVEFYMVDDTGNTLNPPLINPEEVEGRDGFDTVFRVPATYHAIRMRARTNDGPTAAQGGTALDWKIAGVFSLEMGDINTAALSITMKGSDRVTAKLVDPLLLNGTGWLLSNSSYQHSAGVDPLAATISTSVGKIIEVQLKTKNTTVGSVSVTGDHSTILNEGDVWYVRATSDSFTVNITPTADFDGEVFDVFIREVLTEPYASDVDSIEVYDESTSGDVKLRWLIEPVQTRLSKKIPADHVFKDVQDMYQDDDYAFRWNDPLQSAYFENVTFAGTRSGISPRQGGPWTELWNVSQVGGFTDNGIVGPPLISRTDNIFSGVGWTYRSWGYYDHAGNNGAALVTDISSLGLAAGDVVEVTYIAGIDQASGVLYEVDDTYSNRVTPQLVGDTTEVGAIQTSIKPHTIYHITVPANVLRLEYVPLSTFFGQVGRLYISRVLKANTSAISAQHQQGFGNANVADESNIDHIAVYYFTSDGLLMPHPRSVYSYTNADGLTFNREGGSRKLFIPNAYVLGADISWWSDGCIDAKVDAHVNQSTLNYAHRCMRSHGFSLHTIANTELNRHGTSYGAFSIDNSRARMIVHNCKVDGVRCVSAEQLFNQPIANAPTSAVSNAFRVDGIDLVAGLRQLHVSHTMPRLADEAKIACTDMEFQYSLSGQENWQPLAVDDVGLPSPVGATHRTVNLSPNVYDFRIRCLNGRYVGNWTTSRNFTVN